MALPAQFVCRKFSTLIQYDSLFRSRVCRNESAIHMSKIGLVAADLS